MVDLDPRGRQFERVAHLRFQTLEGRRAVCGRHPPVAIVRQRVPVEARGIVGQRRIATFPHII